VLDEPTNGLDPQGIRWLRAYLRSLADAGRLVVLSSHILAEVEQIADDVLVLAHGRLVRSGSLAEWRAAAGVDAVVRCAEPDQFLEILNNAGLASQLTTGGELVVRAPPEHVGEIAAANGIVLHRLLGAGLESAFIALTGESA